MQLVFQTVITNIVEKKRTNIIRHYSLNKGNKKASDIYSEAFYSIFLKYVANLYSLSCHIITAIVPVKLNRPICV